MKSRWNDNKKFDLKAVNYFSQQAQEMAELQKQRIATYDADTRKHERLKARECKYCFYFKGMLLAGQAYTRYDCVACKEEHVWSNTSVPPVCTPCAEKYNLCQNCMGDREMTERKELVEKTTV
jgi:hypothetical protein